MNLLTQIIVSLVVVCVVLYLKHLWDNRTRVIRVHIIPTGDYGLPDEKFRFEVIDKGDWIDMKASVDFELKKGDRLDIPLGVSMELPKGYEGRLLPRSSTCRKLNLWLENSEGVIDNSYSGTNDQWNFRAYAVEDTVIQKGTRIAQFRITKNQPKIKFVYVDELGGSDRGGLGSTGL